MDDVSDLSGAGGVGDGARQPGHGPLAGFTVGVTAARRADELGALLGRRGATVLHAPALRIVPLADDGELMAATKRIVDRAPDVVVATTAIGFRGWVEAADGWGSATPCWSGCARWNCWRAGPRSRARYGPPD